MEETQCVLNVILSCKILKISLEVGPTRKTQETKAGKKMLAEPKVA